MGETWWNCWHWWEWKHERRRDSVSRYQGCLRIRFRTHDPWRSMKPKPIAKSSQATGQKLSTGEPRIWLNLQNWFGENTSDYQMMHGQNRTGMFIFCVWLSSALHGLKVTDGHAQSRHLFDVSSVHIDFWGWIILSPRCCLHICCAQGMKYKAWHRE